MKFTVNVRAFQAALAGVVPVVPARSPKPILQSVKLVVDPEDGTTLLGTDLEVGIRMRVIGVQSDGPCTLILPPERFGSILKQAAAREIETIDIKSTDDTVNLSVIVTGPGLRFEIPLEESDTFPDVPSFTATSYTQVSAAGLLRLIKRTVFSTDEESTRYALGGTCWDFAPESLRCVATDGRRIAIHREPSETVGTRPVIQDCTVVVPCKALKVLSRITDVGDPPIHIAVQGDTANSANGEPKFTPRAMIFRTERAEVYTRLIEGRFPNCNDIVSMLDGAGHKCTFVVGDLLAACEAAAIMTADESRGVDFHFGPDHDAGLANPLGSVMRLTSQAASKGASTIDMPLRYEGGELDITFDPGYLTQMLVTLDHTSDLTARFVDSKVGATFDTDDGYKYIVMPLTRDR